MLSYNLLRTPISLIKKEIIPNIWLRSITTGIPCLCENVEETVDENEEKLRVKKVTEDNQKNLTKAPLELCLEYMESEAYKTTYGDKPVWHVYVRNFKGHLVPETRQSCLTSGGISRTGSPCPICRDIYLLPHYLNVKLLQQFISPEGGYMYETRKTGVCQKQNFDLKVAIQKAKNYGLLTFHIPHRSYDYIIGGGIAGVSCVETLAFLDEQTDILLITSSEIVKAATSAIHLTKTIVELNVEEIHSNTITDKYSNVKILVDFVTGLNYDEKCVETEQNGKIYFERLCICTGGRPNLIDANPCVIGIRDTESVVEFQKRVKSARKIMIVGNGGIASEIVHEVKGVDIVWVIKDDYITKTFIDAGAGEFFQGEIQKEKGETVIKRTKYTAQQKGVWNAKTTNPALGPDWHTQFDLSGCSTKSKLTIEYGAEVSTITEQTNKQVGVHLTNGHHHDVDFIISATGVIPNAEIFTKGNENLKLGPDGGIVVDWKMETTLPGIFAAGDVCHAGWEQAPHWFQMRLWTQARQMGAYSAKCMSGSLKKETVLQDFCFEIFSHVTKLYGFKVVLLGLYNGQKLGDEYELLLRMTRGKEYVKIVMKDGKMQGALLIGDTDLEEMCENLILNQLDLTPFGDDLLNPDIDIEDYFD